MLSPTSRMHALAYLAVALAVWCLTPRAGQAQDGRGLDADTLAQTVRVHPVIDTEGGDFDLWSREHAYRPASGQWDQLARDFFVASVDENNIPRVVRRGTDGERNEDWFGWRRDVLAPFDGTVTRVQHPDSTNAPGAQNDGQPGGIFFERGEVAVVYGHVREIVVEEGERVEAGEVVAKVGNNGNSTAPHIHVGAWSNGTPLQIQVVLHADRGLEPESGTDE